MRIIRRIGSTLLASSVAVALVVGALSLTAGSARAFPPVLLCGPTLLWHCSYTGGPEYLYTGTVCEILLLERRTGLSCVPYTG